MIRGKALGIGLSAPKESVSIGVGRLSRKWAMSNWGALAWGSPVVKEQRAILDPLQDNPTQEDGTKKYKDEGGKDLPDGAVQLNAQLSDAKKELEAAFARVPGLKEKMAERDATRRDDDTCNLG